MSARARVITRSYTLFTIPKWCVVIVSANVWNKIPFNAIFADFMEIEKSAEFALEKAVTLVAVALAI